MAAESSSQTAAIRKILQELEQTRIGSFRFTVTSEGKDGNFGAEPLFERFTIGVSRSGDPKVPIAEVGWLLPAGECLLDPEGREWTYPLLVLKKKDEGFFVGGSLKGKDAPDLRNMLVVPAWTAWARHCWKRFCRDLRRGLDPQIAAVRLEGDLNSPWVSRRGREQAGFSVSVSEKPGDNPLKRIESARQVNIQSLSQEEGLPRLPHKSHKTMICPFQTPESKKIGLNLYRAVNTEYRPDKPSLERIGTEENAFLFSLATGLIPYPHHTDGPRLLMGGKNLKQAEPDIRGAEPPEVPGYLEGERSNLVKEPRVREALSTGRFSPSLGTNAVVAVMPYGGFTFQDGIVVSESFARRMDILKASRTQTVRLDVRIPKKICPEHPEIVFQEELQASVGGTSNYDDPLPLPASLENLARKRRYRFRFPGTLTRTRVSVQPHREDEGEIPLSIRLDYDFACDLPLGIGDKLTGRHGNKGVVTRILPDSETPAVKFGPRTVKVDLILSPCSVIGRKNLGQLWEMIHGLALWAERNRLMPRVQGVSANREIEYKNLVSEILPALSQHLGMDDRGTFPVTIPETGKTVRAFAGIQYFSRLHHHALDKLQARGPEGPVSVFLREPLAAGLKTAQCLGEMENWSVLSYPSKDPGTPQEKFLLELRQVGDRATDVLAKILTMLGTGLAGVSPIAKGNGSFQSMNVQEALNAVLKLGPAYGKVGPSAKDEDDRFWSIGEGESQGLASTVLKSLKTLADSSRFYVSGEREKLKCLLSKERKPAETVGDILEMVENGEIGPCIIKERTEDGQKGKKPFFDLAVLSLFDPETGALKVWKRYLAEAEEVRLALKNCLRCSLSLGKAFRSSPEASERREEDCFRFLRLLQDYRTTLMTPLLGKKGLIRSHMARKRLPCSGRAVIVPAPDLRPDEIYLPRTMLEEIIPEQLEKRLRESVSAWKDSALPETGRLDSPLRAEPAWCLAIRQPSLHRHSVQAFRARCWDRPVIGLPPFVTAGFNADFDGDTMAVIFPTRPLDLAHMSVLRNPGIVGTGAPALETGYDLALGWGGLEKEDRLALVESMGQAGFRFKGPEQERAFVESATLGRALDALLEGQQENEGPLGEAIRLLQKEICAASTGSCSFPPLELEKLHRALQKRISRTPGSSLTKADLAGLVQEEMKRDWLAEGHIGRLISLKAKGGADDLNVMCGALGKQELDVINTETGERETRFIENNLWIGLSDDELFASSYSARSSMASKKLAVAKSGYLSRRLAEGLYETLVSETDCGSETGIGIRYADPGRLLLLPPGGGKPIPFPLMGKDTEKDPEVLAGDLARIAWGRVPVHCKRPLGNDDLRAILHKWLGKAGASDLEPELEKSLQENGGDLILRSPLSCLAEGTNVCAACAGADLGWRPFGTGELLPVGSRVGLTAAQAIGERGTQLAMKRFHTGSGETIDIPRITRLLICRSEKADPEQKLIDLLGCLSDPEQPARANKDLPQQLVHFELALKAPEGLEAWATDIASRGKLAVLSYGGTATRKILASRKPLEPGRSLKDRIVRGEAR